MSPPQSKKRKSENDAQDSPNKKRKLGISAAQKQALIDNLQLEITERARRLRAQYNVQAQQLRSRVEMRVNRIPTALRKLKMGDLLAKHGDSQKPLPGRSVFASRPPPVPAKDGASPKAVPRKPIANSPNVTRAQKRLSDEVADKENSVEPVQIPKKKLHAGASTETLRPGHVLSPASSNVRIVPRGVERPQPSGKSTFERPASPMKPAVARPASPVKGQNPKGSSNIISSMVEKAKGTRGAAAATTRTRNGTVSSTTSSNSGTTGTRTRKPAATPAQTTATTRGRRKVSATSQTSESSTSTVVKKAAASRAPKTNLKTGPATKRTVMSTIKSAATKKAPAKAPAASSATTGRTLRKR